MVYGKFYKTGDDISDSVALRQKIFVEEQGFNPETEFDDEEHMFILCVLYEDDNKPVATGRFIPYDDGVLFGRICVLKECRGKAYGDFLMRMLIRKACDSGFEKHYIQAQVQAQGFYEKLGFKAFGEVYEKGGKPTISMLHIGDIGCQCGKSV